MVKGKTCDNWGGGELWFRGVRNNPQAGQYPSVVILFNVQQTQSLLIHTPVKILHPALFMLEERVGTDMSITTLKLCAINVNISQ